MAWGRRCDLGCESWPDADDYKRCPECGGETTRYSNLRPMDDDEAASAKAHKEFETFYEVYDRKADPARLVMDPEEAVYWDEKYPEGRPDNR